jgi:hypothetical protein
MEIESRWHIYVNDRELPECETYEWFEAAIQEKAARERLDENGLVRCGCGGKANLHYDLNTYDEEQETQGFRLCIGCDKCHLSTLVYIGLYYKGVDEVDVESLAKCDWNRAMGYHD